jgi:DDE superfamily endonuclease
MTLPAEMVAILAPFAPLFSATVWAHAQLLVCGTLLSRGPRTVTAALRAVGHGDDPHFTNYHRVLNRAAWSGLAAASTLLASVLRLVPGTTLVVAIDDLLERRSGARIPGLGVYRDPLTSSRAHQSKSAGLRWVVATALVHLPWSQRPWALPVLSVLAPPPKIQTRKSKAARAARAAGRAYRPRLVRQPRRVALRSAKVSTAERPRHGVGRHKTSIDLASQMLSWLGRRLVGWRIVAVLDGAYGAHKLLHGAARRGAVVVTRLHWDAQLYERPEPAAAGEVGARAASPRQRLASLATVWREVEVAWYGAKRKRIFVTSFEALWTKNHRAPVPVRVVVSLDAAPHDGLKREECFVCTDLEASPEQIIAWFVLRWNQEVTFEEARRHLGVQTQRQWSAKATARTTPVLLGLVSLVTLMTHAMVGGAAVPIRRAPWYDKKQATFSDCLAVVRRELWRARLLSAPHRNRGATPLDLDVIEAMLDALPLTA